MRALLLPCLLAISTWCGAQITGDPPAMPRAALAQKIEGTVTVEITFDEKGVVEDVKIVSSPHEILSEAVLSAVKQWKMEPRLEKGKPVIVVARRSFVFKVGKE
jgi:TonB family protein